MLVRFVPVVEGKSRRFCFNNMWLEAKKEGRVKIPGLLPPVGPEAIISLQAGQVVIHPKRGETFVNDILLEGEQPLSTGDTVMVKRWQESATYLFQSDPAQVKAARREQEASQGIVRHPPDLSSDEPSVRHLMDHFKADESQVGVKGLFSWKYFQWDQLDEVAIQADMSFQAYGSATEAVLKGAERGKMLMQAIFASESESDVDPVFNLPSYNFLFRFRGKKLSQLNGVKNPACVAVAQALEYYAPMDLMKFIRDVT